MSPPAKLARRSWWRVLGVLIPIATIAGCLAGFLVARASERAPVAIEIAPPPAASLPPLSIAARENEIEGRVIASDGSSVPDALVWLRAGDEPHWTYTDAAGNFHFDGLALGPWPTSVLARGFAPLKTTLDAQPAAHTIQLGAPLAAFATLPPIARSTLSGRVLAGLESDLEGYEVVLTPVAPPETIGAPFLRRTPCAHDGRFTFDDLALGSYDVEVRPAWARGGSWPDVARKSPSDAPLALLHTSSASDLVIALQSGEIRGTLANIDGSALEGGLVLITPAADSSRVWPPMSTAADGSFVAHDLPPDRYVVTVHAGAATAHQTIDVHARAVQETHFAPLEPGRKK